MYTDNILLNIKREFSKDEKFAFVLEQLSKAQIEVGILKSENAELEDKVKNINLSKREKKYLAEIANLKSNVAQLQGIINRQAQEIERYRINKFTNK